MTYYHQILREFNTRFWSNTKQNSIDKCFNYLKKKLYRVALLTLYKAVLFFLLFEYISVDT